MIGGVPKRSVFSHARPHIGRQMVGTLDIHRFFPSINALHVRSVFERFAVTGPALDALVRLTTIHNELPQGSPASCFLANLMFDPIDRQIYSLCRRHDLTYTRYIDDMAISGDKDLRPFQGALVDMISKYGLTVSPDKVFWMDRSGMQKITGLCVNEKLRPLKEFIEGVEESLWECRKGGGPLRLALEHGLTVGRLKAKLSGRVRHIDRADPVLGRKLRGQFHDIKWPKRCENRRSVGQRIRQVPETPPDVDSKEPPRLHSQPCDECPPASPPW